MSNESACSAECGGTAAAPPCDVLGIVTYFSSTAFSVDFIWTLCLGAHTGAIAFLLLSQHIFCTSDPKRSSWPLAEPLANARWSSKERTGAKKKQKDTTLITPQTCGQSPLPQANAQSLGHRTIELTKHLGKRSKQLGNGPGGPWVLRHNELNHHLGNETGLAA